MVKIILLILTVLLFSCSNNTDENGKLDSKHYALNASLKRIGAFPCNEGGMIYEFVNDSIHYIIVQDYHGVAITRK